MRTWSIERALIGATQGIWGICGALGKLEQIIRPPRLGHDVDVEDGAEALVEREAEEEVSEPRLLGISDVMSLGLRAATEPGLTLDELVGVRGLLQERYSPNFGGASRWGGQTYTYDPTKSPSPTIVQSAPPPTVDGEGPASVRDIQPSPEAGRSTSDLPLRVMTNDPIEMFNEFILRYVDPSLHAHFADDDDNDAEYVRRLIDRRSSDAVAEWIGEAVPVISEVLAEHVPDQYLNKEPLVRCIHPNGNRRYFDDWTGWRAHVAPILAEALAPHDK